MVGSSLNGFGTRSSDGDLCLVVKEEPCFFQVNQKTEARHILTLVHKHFCTRLSGYIERPQLIRAKVPIVKFRDKVSCVEFDLNVNNVVGIRNTFLLRTYAYLENRVRPLVLVIKKWASHHQINDASRGTLSSYSLVLMVLHYLQTLPEPILPSLQKFTQNLLVLLYSCTLYIKLHVMFLLTSQRMNQTLGTSYWAFLNIMLQNLTGIVK